MKTRTLKLCSLLAVFFVSVLMLISMITNNSIVYNVYAYSGNTEKNESEEIKISSETTFYADSIQPYWYIPASMIYYAAKDNYGDRTYEPTISAGVTLNSEIYYVMATDTSDTTVKLNPASSEYDFTDNETAESHCGLIFRSVYPPPGSFKYANDTRSLKDLDSDLKIPGASTKVSTGKILYRSAPFNSTSSADFGTWKYIELQHEASLFFNEPQLVQVVIIYELKLYHNIFNTEYRHLVAWYNFCIQNR